MSKFTIDSVCPKGPIYPVVINFQNGYPIEEFASKCELLRDQDGSILLATELDELVYSGKEEVEELGKTLILARNKKTGKVRLIEVSCADLKPYRKMKVQIVTPAEDISNLELSRKFGSKKQKQAMEQREKLKINVETVTQQMETVTASVTDDQLDLSMYNKDESEDFYLPQIDRDATELEDVYSLKRILTDEQYDTIFNELPIKYEDHLHPYIHSLIKDRVMLPPQIVVLAAYASELLNFLKTDYKNLKRKDFKMTTLSRTLNDILMNKFIHRYKGTYIRPQPLKDRAVCHILVFALLINNYRFDLVPMCTALRMSPKTMQCVNKIQMTGAHFVNNDGNKQVILRLPLAPKTHFKQRKTKF